MNLTKHNSNGEDTYDGLLRSILADTFTSLKWEGFKPAGDAASHR